MPPFYLTTAGVFTFLIAVSAANGMVVFRTISGKPLLGDEKLLT
jgi:hypothetical protein